MLGKFYSNLHNSGGGIKYDLCNVYKSLLAALIIAIMALAIIPVRAFAEPVELTDFEYSVSDNGVEITRYNGSGGDVVIPSIIDGNPVTAIGDAAFYNCISLTSVTISEGVEIIGDNAFELCRSLTSIKLPSSLKSIGRNSFYQCYALRSVEIPEGVEIIDNWAFAQCTSLTSVTLPSTVTTVGNIAFNGCTSLDNIIYQDGLNVDSARIPDASTQVKYTVGDGKVTITEIILGEGKTMVTIPVSIGGKNVAEIDKDLMQKVAHTHTGGTATCTQKAECTLCGEKYSELAAHNYVDGKCTVCNTPDPDYTQPTETSPTVTTGSSSAWWEPAPVFTTSSTVTTTVTTTVAADNEIIYGDDTGEDISAGAGAYEENSEIFNGLIAFAFLTVLAISAVLIKKLIS